MNVERLRAVQAEEREADSLRPLPDTFYREVADYIDELREQRARAAEAADDPFGAADVRRLTDEIETAEEVAEAIYERRVGKLVKRASLAAAGMPADEEGLTAEEAALFSDLVAQIEEHRDAVLAALAGGNGQRGSEGGSSNTPDERPDRTPGGENDETDGDSDAGDAIGGEPKPPSGTDSDPAGAEPPAPEDPPADVDVAGEGTDEVPDDSPSDGNESTDGGEPGGDPERVTLRITRDVGEVFGVDERVYDLASEDVVTLPAANAKPLLDRDAAEKVD